MSPAATSSSFPSSLDGGLPGNRRCQHFRCWRRIPTLSQDQIFEAVEMVRSDAAGHQGFRTKRLVFNRRSALPFGKLDEVPRELDDTGGSRAGVD